MPAGQKLRANNAFGSVSDNPLTTGATSFNSAALTTLPAIISTQHAVVVFDPKRVFGAPEIVVVTAHTGLSTTATITRALYGTVARSHPLGTVWAHVAVGEDYIQILTSTTRPTDPYQGQSIFETDTMSHRHYTGAIWQSAPPIGTLLPFLGSSVPTGYLFADGAAVSRTGVTADLFAVISTTYGNGDGVTTFNLPDLKSRIPAGRDTGAAEFDVLGETGGAKTVTISTAQLPVHAHGITDVTHNHSDPQHNHGQTNHGHGTGFHNHPADDNNIGSHQHSAAANQFVITSASGPFGLITTGTGNFVTFTTNTASAGNHDHDITVSNANANLVDNVANIQAAGAGLSSALSNINTTNNAGSGSSVTNLQPYITVNYIVKL